MSRPEFNVFPPINRHGAIGDQRTGALISADGTIDWLCLSEFDGSPVFGALLDPKKGGFCRLGPARSTLGHQTYIEDTAALVTRWQSQDGRMLEVTDAMLLSHDQPRDFARNRQIIIRRLRASSCSQAILICAPRWNFSKSAPPVITETGAALFSLPGGTLSVWATFPFHVDELAVRATLMPAKFVEHWVVLEWGTEISRWSARRAARALKHAIKSWQQWSRDLKNLPSGPRREAVCRSAITVRMLSHWKLGSVSAALSCSLPERIGGDRNYDYRYAWIRDDSLALALMARLGKTAEVRRYLDWLCNLDTQNDTRWQPVYHLDGSTSLDQKETKAVTGYAGSLPIRIGNVAAEQRQLGSLGFMADCIRIYVAEGGRLEPEHWGLVQRAAEYICSAWTGPDNGIWELRQPAHYVSSKVMAWVVLQSAVFIGNRLGQTGFHLLRKWQETAEVIHTEVMHRGWSEKQNSFLERYGSNSLDAASLLIPLVEFLPVQHPRVVETLAALDKKLVINGLIHRFDPVATLGEQEYSIGNFEGAFLPAVFWHAHVLAKAGRPERADAILKKCEAVSGAPGLFAEEIDANQNVFLGNTPQLFSHVEYVRAVMAIEQARVRQTPNGH